MIRDFLLAALAVVGATASVSWLLGNAALARTHRPRPRSSGPAEGRPSRDDFGLVA